MSSQPQTKDKLVVIIMLFLAIAGSAFCIAFRDQVFPSAAIDFKVSKEKILASSQAQARRLGYAKEGMVESIVFEMDDNAKTFLEYELGAKEANKIMGTIVPVFYWVSEFSKPFDQETMVVYVSPGGDFLGFRLSLPNDKTLPSLSLDDARKRAMSFLTNKTRWQESELKLISEETNPRLHRTDYSFTWEYQKLDFKKAKLRANVAFSGDRLSYFWVELKVPEAWERDYETTRSYNELLSRISFAFIWLAYPIALFICLTGIQRRNIRLKFSLIVGAILALVGLVDDLNDLPYRLSWYTPESSYQSFMTITILGFVSKAVGIFFIATIMAGAGELIYRQAYPKRLLLEHVFSFKGLATRELRVGLTIGILWCIASVGYQALYYWAGRYLGFWCPLFIDSYQVLSSYAPWFGAAAIGVFASTNEEIISRVITLTLAQKLFRSFWPANFTQAIIWGFAHSNYDQQPCYARGVEIGLAGLVDGWIMRRYGLLPCLVSHYLFDAFCGIEPLLKAPLDLRLTAALPFVPVVFLALIVVTLMAKARHPLAQAGAPSHIEPDPALLNASIPLNIEAATPPTERAEIDMMHYHPLSRKSRILLLAGIVAGLVAWTLIDANKWTLGEIHKPQTVTRDGAITLAKQYLHEEHLDLRGYLTSTSISNRIQGHSDEYEYLQEKVGFHKTKELVERFRSPRMWEVNFKKPLSPNAYGVLIDSDGHILSPLLSFGEDEKGRSISDDEAKLLARKFIEKYRPEFLPVTLDHFERIERKHRSDFAVTFASPQFKVGDASLKVEISIAGDKVSLMSQSWDLPDAWKWERAKKTALDNVLRILQGVVIGGITITVLILIFREFRRGTVHWRAAAVVGLIAALLNLAQSINALPAVFETYRSTQPLASFYVQKAVGIFMGLMAIFCANTFALAIVLSVLQDKLPVLLHGTLAMLKPPHRDEYATSHKDFWLDAVLLGLFNAIFVAVLAMIWSYLNFASSGSPQVEPDMYIQSLVNSLSGPFYVLASQLSSGLLAPLIAFCVVVCICLRLRLTSLWKAFVLVALLTALFSSTERHWQDFFMKMLFAILGTGLLWFVLKRCGVRNPLSIALFTYYIQILGTTEALLRGCLPNYLLEFSVCIALISLPVVYLLYNQTIYAAVRRFRRNSRA